MASLERSYALAKLCLLVFFCFGVGCLLLYDGIAGKKQVAFDDVFPGIAAITAGFLTLGLIFYIYHRSRAEGEPTAATEERPAPPETTPAEALDRPAAPVAPAKWNEMTPMRRQLIPVALIAIVLFASILFRVQRAAKNAVGAGNAGPPPGGAPAVPGAQLAAWNRQAVAAKGIELIEGLLDSTEDVIRAVEELQPELGALSDKGKREVETTIASTLATLREQRDRLDALQNDAPNRDRFAAVKARCAAQIERLVRLQTVLKPNDK